MSDFAGIDFHNWLQFEDISPFISKFGESVLGYGKWIYFKNVIIWFS